MRQIFGGAHCRRRREKKRSKVYSNKVYLGLKLRLTVTTHTLLLLLLTDIQKTRFELVQGNGAVSSQKNALSRWNPSTIRCSFFFLCFFFLSRCLQLFFKNEKKRVSFMNTYHVNRVITESRVYLAEINISEVVFLIK